MKKFFFYKYSIKINKMNNIYIIAEIIINKNDKLKNFIINKKIFKKQYLYIWNVRSHIRLLKQFGLLDNSLITLNHINLLKRLLKFVNINKEIFHKYCSNADYEKSLLIYIYLKFNIASINNIINIGYKNINLIIFASENGHLEIVRLLLTDCRVDPSADNNYAIRLANIKGHLEVVRLLLTDCRIDPSYWDNFIIKIASHDGHLEIVRLLLTDSRVDPSADNNLALVWASEKGHLKVVRLLLTDSRVNARHNYAILHASENGHLEVVRLLLTDSRVTPSANNNYAIRLASEKGYQDVVKLLKADPRYHD